MTKMGHENPAETKQRDVAAARDRVSNLLRADMLKQEARSREQAGEEMVRTGHEEQDMADLQRAYNGVMAGKAHEVEKLLRDNLPQELAADIEKIVAANRESGV